MKANGEAVTPRYLNRRVMYLAAAGYGKTKWITFCERMMQEGFSCYLYEARQTFSKYITVTDHKNISVKVRFSDHKPIYQRELKGDCDFFVGVTHTGVRTTDDAIKFILSKKGVKID